MRSTTLTAVVLCLLVPTSARADTWDLNLGRLCQIMTRGGQRLECGGGYTEADPVAYVIPDNAAFRSLMSELGAVFAPNILSPSETQGYSGFNFAAEFGWTKINPRRRIVDPNYDTTKADTDPRNQNAIKGENYYWRAAESVSGRAFTNPLMRDYERIDNELPSGFAPTVTVMARKGLWIPVPSFELGIGVRHLIGSQMWAPLATAKLALHEGFHGWPVPSLAIRGSGARVLGTPGYNLTVAGLDFSVSKRFGIASTFNLTPYVGYQLLWIIADSEVIDATPGIDGMGRGAKASGGDPMSLAQCRDNDCNANFTFTQQANITRHRFFLGLKANFYIASLLVEYTFFASGSKSDEIATQVGVPSLIIPDNSGQQHTISFSIALDY
jgi:hypothetical protein